MSAWRPIDPPLSAPLFAALCFTQLIAPLCAVPPQRPYSVDRYDVRITPDLEKQQLSGETTIHYRSRVEGLKQLELDAAPTVEIAATIEGGTHLQFEHKEGLLLVTLARPASAADPRVLTVQYIARPGKGLKFFPDQVYSAYFADEWMVCSFRPDERATLLLSIAAKPDWQVAGSGDRAGEADGVSKWRFDTPVPAFLFGFAAGRFQVLRGAPGVDPSLRLLGSPEAMQSAPAIFDATRSALRFFADKTGKAYPAPVYTQVFTRGNPEQENADLTLMPESYGIGLYKHPEDLWLLAHELAHQWYAVRIPCQDWSDFWLNEGVATFLADAFLERRFGRDRYEKEIDDSRATYERLKSQGKDRALSFHNWNTTAEASGRIPYSKGAYVLDLLRREMGEDDFWRGLRIYTRDNWNKPVTSRDFQKAMEAASLKNLTPFFDRWVYQ